jgi:hypothetical protein
MTKTYKPLDEDGEHFPPESQIVQQSVPDTFKDVEKTLSSLFDITATKDGANQTAKANLSVDGNVILKDVPATTLLFLEKQLTDLHTFVQKVPVLDPAHKWDFDAQASLYKTAEQLTSKSKKVHKPIVLAQATEHHPAQTQLVLEDQLVGHWTRTGLSGAIPGVDKTQLLERIQKLQKAVKFARESANQVEAPQRNISNKVFGYLFGK